MVTKAGKHHYTCKARWFNADGTLKDERKFAFVAADPVKHLEKIRKPYVAHRMWFEWEDLEALD